MTPEALQRALEQWTVQDMPALPGRRNHLLSGILVPIQWCPHPTAILTLRAATLRNHGGEISFPGGRPDPEDGALEVTALREAREELGISEARILGRLSSVPLFTSDYRMMPFVAEVPATLELIPAPDEVAQVLRVPLHDVLSLPHLHGIPWEWEGVEYMSPVFELEGLLLYGGTAHTFLELLTIAAPLLGKTIPPWKTGAHTWESILKRPV